MELKTVGFSGTSDLPTAAQYSTLRHVLTTLKHQGYRRLVHGDCVGSDEIANAVARSLGYQTKSRPGSRHDGKPNEKRAFCLVDETEPVEKFLDRDQKIVADSAALVATPRNGYEVVRSGTWATIRYARNANIPRYIILPDGFISREGIRSA